VIDHVYISVTNIERSLAFYVEALKPLGWRPVGNYDSASGPLLRLRLLRRQRRRLRRQPS
jgi:catechol 2,3-dioxygenase-like lactoylglutathione lyase family enzyme